MMFPDLRVDRKRFVALVGCGKSKRRGPCPAQDLYTGGLTRACMAWARRNCETWCILSAKYGVLSPVRQVDKYELKLTDLGREQREVWGHEASARLLECFPRRSFLALAGSDYLAVLSVPFVPLFGPGMPMGQRLRWLKLHPLLTEEVLQTL